MIYVADATPECGGHRIYWCGQCGLIGEHMPLKMYEMIPEWSRKRLEQEDRKAETFVFIREQVRSPSKVTRRLGKGLNEIAAQPAHHLNRLLLGKGDVKDP